MALVAQDPSAGFRSTGSFFEALVAQGGEGPRLLLLSHFEVEGGGKRLLLLSRSTGCFCMAFVAQDPS